MEPKGPFGKVLQLKENTDKLELRILIHLDCVKLGCLFKNIFYKCYYLQVMILCYEIGSGVSSIIILSIWVGERALVEFRKDDNLKRVFSKKNYKIDPRGLYQNNLGL